MKFTVFIEQLNYFGKRGTTFKEPNQSGLFAKMRLTICRDCNDVPNISSNGERPTALGVLLMAHSQMKFALIASWRHILI